MESPQKMPRLNRPGWSRFAGSLLIGPVAIPAAFVVTTTFLCYMVTPRNPKQTKDNSLSK